MSWQELRKEALQLTVSDRLALAEAIIQSLQFELETRQKVPKGTLTRLRGLLKTDALPPTDAEIEAMLEERLEKKYL